MHEVPAGGPELGPLHTAALFTPPGPADVIRDGGITLLALVPGDEEQPTVCVEDWLSDEEVEHVRATWASAIADIPPGHAPALDVKRVCGDLVVVVTYSAIETRRSWAARPGTRRRRRVQR